MLIGATLAMIGLIVHNGSSSSLALVNNILAANGSALIAYLLKRTRAFGESSSTKALLNGALAGVVSESNIDIRFSGRKWLKQTNIILDIRIYFGYQRSLAGSLIALPFCLSVRNSAQ